MQDRLVDAGEPPSWPAANGTVKVPAAWLIEQAGFAKGYAGAGGVAISTKHTLALTNRGERHHDGAAGRWRGRSATAYGTGSGSSCTPNRS